MTVHFGRPLGAMSEAELRAEIAEIEPKLAKAFQQAGSTYDASKISVLEGDTASKSRQLHDLNSRLGDLRQFLDLKSMRIGRIAPESDDERDAREGGGKSLGARLVKSGGLMRNGPDVSVPFSAVEMKTLFETGAGWAPESMRAPRVQLSAQRMPNVLDLLPVVTWTNSVYPFMEETTLTNGAVEKAEAAAFGEATLVLTEREVPIRKIPVFLPVTDELLEDVAGARTYIDSRLGFMILQRLSEQILVGDGTAPNISGFLDNTGISTQARGSDPIFDAIAKAITKCRETGKAEPDAIVIHPTAWESARLTRTADGIYLLGNPADFGAKGFFGLPAITDSAIGSGKALAGSFAGHSALIQRSGIEIKVSDSHSDYFTTGRQAIRAQVRVGLAIYRPAAFTEVTGL